MMDLIRFVSALKTDPPFSYPHPDERTKSLLVETSSVKLFKQELGIRYRNFMHNSGITDIMGRARSGKTHLIYNIEYITNVEGRYKGLVVILPGQSYVGQKIDHHYLFNYIVRSAPFQKKALELGIDISKNRQNNAELINLLIEKMRVKDGPDVGILFAVDDIDEHVRKVSNLKEDLEEFLGAFRLLIQAVDKGLCVVFSLTEDAFEKLKVPLADPTLAGRFDFIYDPSDPGKALTLSELSEDEAILMVSLYMDHWSRRNKISLPEPEKCLADGNNIFPFTPDAIKLFRSASPWAGHICKGCINALSRKGSAKTEEELIVAEEDAAIAISASAGMFPNFPALRPRISNLIGGPRIESEIKSWINTIANTKYSGDIYKGGFKTAFRNYLEIIAKESEEKIKFESDVTVIDPYTQKHHNLDMKLGLDGLWVGVVFTPNPVADPASGKPLSIALTNRNITHGMFIYAGKKPELDFRGERKQGLSTELHRELRDRGSGIDYGSVVSFLPIDEFDAWGIIRGHEITDPNMMVKVLGWIEGRLQMIDRLRKLISATPREMPPPPPPSAGKLLGGWP